MLECRLCGRGAWTASAAGVCCAECGAPLAGAVGVPPYPHQSAMPPEAQRAPGDTGARPLSYPAWAYLAWGWRGVEHK